MNDAFERALAEIPREVALPHAAELPVLGVPVRFETDSADALALFEETFGAWRALPARDIAPGPPARLALVVRDDRDANGLDAPVDYRLLDGDRHVLRTRGSVAVVDGARREARARVAPAFLADRQHARYTLMEGLTLTLVSAHNRFPVHAAAVARGGAALLLAGPPGTGKSTLAYQAHRGGLRVLSDDAVYVEVEPALRVWGTPGRIRLLASARAHFPELGDRAPTLLANGDEKLVVDLRAEAHAPGAWDPTASRAAVCLLERGRGPARLARVGAGEARAFLRDGLGLSRNRFGEGLDRALERLIPGGAWRLSLSERPSEAARFVEEMLAAPAP